MLANTKSNSELHEIQFGSLANLEVSTHSYVFTMTGTSSMLYGCCVVHNELLSVRDTYNIT